MVSIFFVTPLTISRQCAKVTSCQTREPLINQYGGEIRRNKYCRFDGLGAALIGCDCTERSWDWDRFSEFADYCATGMIGMVAFWLVIVVVMMSNMLVLTLWWVVVVVVVVLRMRRRWWDKVWTSLLKSLTPPLLLRLPSLGIMGTLQIMMRTTWFIRFRMTILMTRASWWLSWGIMNMTMEVDVILNMFMFSSIHARTCLVWDGWGYSGDRWWYGSSHIGFERHIVAILRQAEVHSTYSTLGTLYTLRILR